MSALTKEEVQAEAELCVRRALAHIQEAQGRLDLACAELSKLMGGIPVWRATGKVSDRVRQLWYQVERFRGRGRFKLDDISVVFLASARGGK